MKKLLFILSLFCASSSYAQTMVDPKSVTKETTCIDGIVYFLVNSYQGPTKLSHKFVSTAKINSKTMQPQKCD